jgi:hypothetical protein
MFGDATKQVGDQFRGGTRLIPLSSQNVLIQHGCGQLLGYPAIVAR